MCSTGYGKIKRADGRRRIKAQSSLEIVVALIPVLIILFCVVNLFFWLNHRLAYRQHKYEESRIVSGTSDDKGRSNAVFADESGSSRMHVFTNDFPK